VSSNRRPASVGGKRDWILLAPVALILLPRVLTDSLPLYPPSGVDVWPGLMLLSLVRFLSIPVLVIGIAWLFVELFRRGAASDPVSWVLRIFLGIGSLVFVVLPLAGYAKDSSGWLTGDFVNLAIQVLFGVLGLAAVCLPVLLARRTTIRDPGQLTAAQPPRPR
jgi:hypothetical protein